MVTQKQAIQLIRGYGMRVKVVDGEYQVSIPGRPQSTYYTDDAKDAVLTAKHMHDREIAHLGKKKFGLFGA